MLLIVASPRTKSSVLRCLFRCGCAALALLSQPALAQNTPSQIAEDRATSIKASDSDTGSQSDIVVTANKRPQKLGEVGTAISVVTSAQLDKLSANSLQDYLQLLPGVSLGSAGAPGRSSLAIRGISPQSVGATVATYIDNIPYGGSSSDAQGGNYFPDFNPSDVERIEVLKGPQGTLYGAASLGGVVKYVTKQPSMTLLEGAATEDFSLTSKGDPSYKIRGAVSVPLIEDKLAMRVSGNYRRIGGYVDNVVSGKNDVNGGDDYGGHLTVAWAPVAGLSFSLNLFSQGSTIGGLDAYDLDPDSGKPLYGDLKVARYVPESFKSRINMASLEISKDISFGSILSASSYSRQYAEDLLDYTNLLGLNADTPAAYDGTHETEKFTQELRLTSRRMGPLELIGGGFFQHEDLTNINRYIGYTAAGRPDPLGPIYGIANRTATLDEYAGFVNATLYLSKKFDVAAGYRHSYIKQTFQSIASGLFFTGGADIFETTSGKSSESPDSYMAGARWRPADGVMFYARAASGYRPGGSRSVPPGAPAGFGDSYKSDSIWSYEVGTKIATADKKLTLEADAFWIDWTDIQTLVSVGRVSTDGNGGKARSRGAELQATYSPFSGLRLSGNTTYTDAVFTETVNQVVSGQRLSFIPKFSAGAAIDYQFRAFSGWDLSIGGDYSYSGSRKNSTGHTLQEYSIVNLHASLTDGRHEISAYVRNAFDKRAILGDINWTPGAPPWSVIPYRPLTVGISATQRF